MSIKDQLTELTVMVRDILTALQCKEATDTEDMGFSLPLKSTEEVEHLEKLIAENKNIKFKLVSK